MERSQLIKKVENIKNLPTLPVIALTVNKLLRDVDSPMDELVKLLEKDQSLVMKILRLVNSSFYGFKCKVSSVRHAITLMGYNTIQNAVITVSIIDSLALEKNFKDFRIEKFWEHSINVAVLSKFLASKTKLASPDDAFTAGLLHDIGKVVLANFFPEELIEVIRTTETEKMTFSRAEQTLGQTPHCTIGGVLARRWMLPAAIVESIQYHHRASKFNDRSNLISLIHISDIVVNMMAGNDCYSLTFDDYGEDFKRTLMQFFQKESDWLKEIRIEMNKACAFFNGGK